jgi:hypothetical protein
MVSEMLEEALKTIPPCSIFVMYGKGFISKFISWYYFIRNPQLIGKTMKASHAGIYWGSGKNETVETRLVKIFNTFPYAKVTRGNLIDDIIECVELSIYSNIKMTVDSMQMAKQYSYGTCGRSYDIPAFIHFAVDKIKQVDDMDICTENAINTISVTNTPIMMSKDSSEIHPIELQTWLESNVATNQGWVKTFQFSDGKLLLP